MQTPVLRARPREPVRAAGCTAHWLVGSERLETVAFRNADDRSTALIVLNTAASGSKLAVRAGEMWFTTFLPAGAVATFSWK